MGLIDRLAARRSLGEDPADDAYPEPSLTVVKAQDPVAVELQESLRGRKP